MQKLHLQKLIRQKLPAFWQFCRPHTVIGTSLSTVALFSIAQSTFQIANLWLLFPALIACLCGNVYIVGLNQLEDIEIDKINKPHLPLASGDFSVREAQIIVAVAGVFAVSIAAANGLFLCFTVISSLLIGTAYSLPPIRLKRFPLWASVCIFVVRGVVVNLGLFLHFNQILNQSLNIPPSIWALTTFVLIFTYVIAIFKDIPDTEGDRTFNISTLSLKLGQRAVFNLSRQILITLYLGLAILSLTSILTGVNIAVIVITHCLFAAILWWRSLRVDLSDRNSITDFYQFIWKLFYLEYIIFPIICIFSQSR